MHPTPLTQKELIDLFGAQGAPPENTFEIALVLGGTVSAGAYTAGVLDFLFEALDCWNDAKGSKLAPTHKVVVRIITGASGGAVNAAIAARALATDFPHIRFDTPLIAGKDTANPFYDIWVRLLDLKEMLGTSDLADGTVPSLLDGSVLDKGAKTIVDYTGKPRTSPRTYLANPLRLMLTLTNLRGVPFEMPYGGSRGLTQTYVDHADFARFAVMYPGMKAPVLRPDELGLSFTGATPQSNPWSQLAQCGLGSSAFPVGLPSRVISRLADDYKYRVTLVPRETGGADIVPLVPDWDAMGVNAGDTFTFATADGGATDNEPVELARTALCGLGGRNPRSGKAANRAVILVDPFAGAQRLGPPTAQDMIQMVEGLIPTLIQQTRYDSSDIKLALDNGVYSRFMIAAVRDGMTGDAAIASSGLGAFLGFACEAYRRHDYLLGRANCQGFLRSIFGLPEDAEVFKGCWTADQVKALAMAGPGPRHLPLIPLLGSANDDQKMAPWPSGELDPTQFQDAMESRFRIMVANETSTAPFWLKALIWLVKTLGAGKVADIAISAIRSEQGRMGL